MTAQKILIVGARGTVGRALLGALGERHQLIEAGRSHPAQPVDLGDSASIRALFERIGRVDAIVSTAGQLHFGPLAEMGAEQFRLGLHSKLLGQVDLALIGQHWLNEGGSITLTSGIVAEEPIRLGANASTVNAAVEGFVRAAAIELTQGCRINAVSPSVLQESMGSYAPFFPGFEPVPGARVAQAYVRSIEGAQTGRIYRVW